MKETCGVIKKHKIANFFAVPTPSFQRIKEINNK